MNSNEIVAKLWNLCHTLRDGGVSYHEYVTELSYLLFLKLMNEMGSEEGLPEGYRWDDLVANKSGTEGFTFYKTLLLHLGTEGSDQVKAIFVNSNSSLRKPATLEKLVTDLDNIDWYTADKDDLGDMYEGLLQKNADEKKSGAGQYFTPRVLIETIVKLCKPQVGEVIQDPAAGTGGFLIAADRFIRSNNDMYSLPLAQQDFQAEQAFRGMELVPDTHRLLLMNCMLHGLSGKFQNEDTLTSNGESLEPADLILSNPPFGSKRGSKVTREFTYSTNNKQLCFLQHIYRGLKAGGRAAVVLPDNVLFEEGVGTKIRADLMDKCNLHTILRLPTGIFYAQGVKTNVLFFTRGAKETGCTRNTWVYDLRTNMPVFGKRTPLTEDYFAEFIKCYGRKSDGTSKRTEKTGGRGSCRAIYADDTVYEGEESRFRKFTRDFVSERGDNLDISWLKDEDASGSADLPEPDEIAAMIRERLGEALAEMDALTELLGAELLQPELLESKS